MIGNVERFFLVSMMLLFLAPSVLAQQSEDPIERDPVFEQEILDRLAEIDADAVPLFEAATHAMDSGQFETAQNSYEEVLELAPDFPDALRRLSYIEVELGRPESAVAVARRALAVEESPLNQAAVARALLATEDSANYREALSLASRAVDALPDDDYTNYILLYAAIEQEDMPALRQASTALVDLSPEDPFPHYLLGLLLADDGKWEQAERELQRAQDLGMPAEDVQRALDNDISSKAAQRRWLRRGEYALGAWLGGFVILFGLGFILSKLTLFAVGRYQHGAAYSVGGAERMIRSVYRTVITITSFYYYISLPILILVVLGATGGIFYGFLVVGRIPIRLAIFLGIAALYTCLAVVRSIFTQVKQADPGRPLGRDEAPEFWSLSEDVAQRIGTRPIDKIFITPGPEIGVTERGGMFKKITGAGERYMILGMGALPGMTQSQFKAILAHEYGHFSNRDTAGGGLAMQVQRSMHQMAYNLAVSGQARWYNPAWLFLRGFFVVFQRVTLGASRLQEVLADRYAAIAYGARNFKEGLIHVVRQSVMFDAQVNMEVNDSMKESRKLNNLYALPSPEDNLQKSVEDKVQQILQQPTSAYDSHPAVKDRIRLVEKIESSHDADDVQEPILALLPHAEALQDEMTAIIQGRLAQQAQMARRVTAARQRQQ